MTLTRGWQWPAGVTLVLALTVAANIWVIRTASGDPTFAIEPDYYTKAVQWDAHAAQEAANRRLAWQLAATLGAPGAGTAPLTVELRDAQGVHIEGVVMQVEALSNLGAAHPVRAVLTPDGAGRYRADLPLAHRGLWELRFTATRGSDTFTATVRLDTPPA